MLDDDATVPYGAPWTDRHDVPTYPADDHTGHAPGIGITPSSLSRLRWIRRALAAGDTLSLMAALVLVQLVSVGRDAMTLGFAITLAIGPLIWVAVFHTFGLYGWNGLSRPSVFDEIRNTVGATATGIFLLVIVSVWWDRPPTASWLAGVLLTALASELLTRWLIRWKVRHQKRQGRLALRTLVVGANDEARWLRKHLAAPGGWFTPVGSIATSQERAGVDGLPFMGGLHDLDQAIQSSGAECVFVAATSVTSDDVLRISRACRRHEIEMRLSANVNDVLSSRLSVLSADGVTTIAFKPVRPTPAQEAFKRALDLTLGSLLLILAMPLLVVIAATIALTSSGPVVFRQARVTKDERIFTIYKFRTMVRDADRSLDDRVIDLTKPFFKMNDDPRLTPVGRFLRAFSLDELPQLWNVIRGDMSLVGPRPLPAEQVAVNRDFLSPRHEVHAGLTGLWQISGRSDLESEDALRMDRFYIENWSPSLDLYILAKTVATVLTRRGAY